ncbi:MAG TPA: preprotein translocase subunit SecE [Dongiaceae bacterium]|nr:preprotein translocase subunit SecE [Dongiaceae bacterium]
MAEKTKVTRIKATETAPKAKKSTEAAKSKAVKAKPGKAPRAHKERKNWLVRALLGIGGYFKGAWTELRLVRWPTRRATWGLTLAVILFSAFFVVVILLLDAGFKYLFEIIIGK